MALIKIKSESMNLADDYTFTGTVTGAGGGALIKTGSLTSTSDAGSYSLDSCFSSTYLNYFVTFKYAIATDGNQCYLKFRTGGSTNSEANYQSYIRYNYQDGSTANTNNANGTSGVMAVDLEATDSQGMQGFMYIFAPFSTSYYTMVTTNFNSKHNGGAKQFHRGGITFDATTSFDGFQFTQNTGNGSLVDLQCWGIKE
jgi:hypothetical protein